MLPFATAETAYPAYLTASRVAAISSRTLNLSFYSRGVGEPASPRTPTAFEALTAGRWLAEKLTTAWMSRTHPFRLRSTCRCISARTTSAARRFLRRPVTMRRGFELVHGPGREEAPPPDIRIHMGRMGRVGLEAPDSCQPRAMKLRSCRRCTTGAAPSLVAHQPVSPAALERCPAGMIPVVNDAPNNRPGRQSQH